MEQKSLTQQAVEQVLAEVQNNETNRETPTNDSIGIAPYAALFGGQGADLATTMMALRSGKFKEGNELLGSSMSTIAPIKIGTSALMAYLMHKLDASGHDKAAKIAGYAGGLAGGIPATINAINMRKHR